MNGGPGGRKDPLSYQGRRAHGGKGVAVKKIVLAGALVLTCAASAGARAAETSYTAAQAAAGAKLYQAQCSACHGARLQGVTAPALRGGPTMATRTGAELYDFMSTQMPLTKPGSLTPAQYAAVMAFLLKANGHRAGTTALTPARARTIATPI